MRGDGRFNRFGFDDVGSHSCFATCGGQIIDVHIAFPRFQSPCPDYGTRVHAEFLILERACAQSIVTRRAPGGSGKKREAEGPGKGPAIPYVQGSQAACVVGSESDSTRREDEDDDASAKRKG